LLYSLGNATMSTSVPRKNETNVTKALLWKWQLCDELVSVVKESFEWRHPIVGAGKWQVNDGLHAEVPLWCASGPIARRWIVPTCVWKLSDCKNKRSCWKNSLGMSVSRPCGSDVYVCSKSFRLCLTVVYWLLECNKVPSWIENPEYVTTG
jgi:hypothetical protein